MAKKWYVIHTYSGFEAKVRDALQQRAKQHALDDKIGEILIPSETVTENRPGGKTRVRQKLSLPGYIFVEMDMNEVVWHLVKDTPKVTGFIGNQTPQEVPAPQIESLRRGIDRDQPPPRRSFWPAPNPR
jgi:transcriptional antiterminator NusG